MKPRNKKQQGIMALSGQLRPLTPGQKQRALSNTISHYGFRLKSGMCTCMKCGHEWLEVRNGTHLCPECGSIIEIKDTKERVIRDKSYFNIITTKRGYQVVRMFLMMVEMRKGMKAQPAFLEIGQYWIDDKGKATVVGIQRTLGHYIDSFAFGSPLEIRNDNDAFQHIAREWVYPKIKVTDTIKRNGFKTSTYYIHPVTLFKHLLTTPKADTLVFTATMEGKTIATVEISLNDYSILQCRAFANGICEYTEQIAGIINSNKSLIAGKHTVTHVLRSLPK